MNPVFWLLVILVLVGVWFALTPLFRLLGRTTLKNIFKAKEQMSDENQKTKNKGENCDL